MVFFKNNKTADGSNYKTIYAVKELHDKIRLIESD